MLLDRNYHDRIRYYLVYYSTGLESNPTKDQLADDSALVCSTARAAARDFLWSDVTSTVLCHGQSRETPYIHVTVSNANGIRSQSSRSCPKRHSSHGNPLSGFIIITPNLSAPTCRPKPIKPSTRVMCSFTVTTTSSTL